MWLVVIVVVGMMVWLSGCKTGEKMVEEKTIKVQDEEEQPVATEKRILNLTISTLAVWNYKENDKESGYIYSFNVNGKKKTYKAYLTVLSMKINSVGDRYFLTVGKMYVTDSQGIWKKEMKFNYISKSFDIDEKDDVFLFNNRYVSNRYVSFCYRYSKDLKFKKKYYLGEHDKDIEYFVDGGRIWTRIGKLNERHVEMVLEYDKSIKYNPLSRKMLKYKIVIDERRNYKGSYYHLTYRKGGLRYMV